MRSLRHRSSEPELMDGDNVAPDDFAACMADLATVNTLTLARRPTLAFVKEMLAARPGQIPTIVDVGFGAGDMLRAVGGLAQRLGREVRLVGYDINPRSEPVARAATPPGLAIEWRTGDAFAHDGPVDAVISSLVTHHMDDAAIVRFLGWMEHTARAGWLVNDLRRHAFPYLGFTALAHAMHWHRFVRHDGPLSIARSFRREDWQRLLAEAGVAPVARIEPWFPFRLCVARRKW